jgi:hypothetical protein
MRRLMVAGVPPPKQGRDARGWRRLLEWRTALGHGLVQREYQEFTRELEAIPAHQRVSRVLDGGCGTAGASSSVSAKACSSY